jgi:hypothetical protein
MLRCWIKHFIDISKLIKAQNIIDSHRVVQYVQKVPKCDKIKLFHFIATLLVQFGKNIIIFVPNLQMPVLATPPPPQPMPPPPLPRNAVAQRVIRDFRKKGTILSYILLRTNNQVGRLEVTSLFLSIG